ncbi:MAG: hypothetical protein LBH03_06370 [Holophagales bacterium]|jgi:predicted  nucleic acid-binding Zn-ribbon protein|nr:hypothetical protein [Holophagales bacterium]
MNTLDILKELQAAHDGLRTIQRDLSILPPEMVHLNTSVKAADKRFQEIEKNIAKAKVQLEAAERQCQQAVKSEAHARKELKASAHKVQYTAAMRELDEKERQLENAQRTLAETKVAIKSMETESENLVLSRNEYQRQFDELHEIFLAEHENQVVAKDRLTKQVDELGSKLDATTLNKFNRLVQNRGGKAIVAVENSNCTGCNTKLRTPLIYQIKAEGSIICEYCQRFLYLSQ